MKKYTRPSQILRDEQGDVVGVYAYEDQAVEAAKVVGPGTYTLTRPTGTYEGGSGPVMPAGGAPVAPSGLVATPISATAISLAWTDNSDNELNFIVERSDDGATGWTVVKTVAPLTIITSDTNLDAESQYYYRVKATNADGDSGYTAVANATTPAVVAPSTSIPAGVRAEIEGRFTIQPQDANGWTILTPNANTLVYYIDFVNGDDATATPYAYDAFADMQNPTMAGLITYKTLEGAWLNQSGDKWFLLRGGTDHTFAPTTNPNKEIPSGVSPTERLVIAGYDIDANGMPRIPYQPNGEMKYWAGTNYTSIIGIDFYSPERDPDHAEFVGFANADAIGHGIDAYGNDEDNGGGVGENWNVDNLIEGCRFIYAQCIASYCKETIIRRNVFYGNYSSSSHAQGLYAGRGEILLEENIFDHTGWWKQSVIYNDKAEGAATIFNHNTYFSSSSYCLFRNNIFSRPSSIGNKFTSDPPLLTPASDSVDTIRSSHILIENNFYDDCEVVASLGGNTDYSTGPRWEHMYFLDNAATGGGESQPTGRSIGWYIDVQDWKTGAVAGNVLRGGNNDLVSNVYGINVFGHCSDISINANTFYNLGQQASESTATVMQFRQATIDITYTNSNDDPMTNIVVDNNYCQNPDSLSQLLSSTCVSGVAYTGNTFYGASTDTSAAFRTDLSGDLDFAAWNTEVGGTNTYGPTTFTEPTRTAAAYMASIGGVGTKQGFLDAIRAQSYDNWNPQLTGGVIAAYIKTGLTPV